MLYKNKNRRRALLLALLIFLSPVVGGIAFVGPVSADTGQNVSISPSSDDFKLASNGGPYTFDLTTGVTKDEGLLDEWFGDDKATDPYLTVGVESSGSTASPEITGVASRKEDYNRTDSGLSRSAVTLTADEFEDGSVSRALVRVKVPEGADKVTLTAIVGSDNGGETTVEETYTVIQDPTSWEALAAQAEARSQAADGLNDGYNTIVDRESVDDITDRGIRKTFTTATEFTGSLLQGAIIGSVPYAGPVVDKLITINEFRQYANSLEDDDEPGPWIGPASRAQMRMLEDASQSYRMGEIDAAGNSSFILTRVSDLADEEAEAWRNQNRSRAVTKLKKQEEYLNATSTHEDIDDLQTPDTFADKSIPDTGKKGEHGYYFNLIYEAQRQGEEAGNQQGPRGTFEGNPETLEHAELYFEGVLDYAIQTEDDLRSTRQLVQKPDPSVELTNEDTVETQLGSTDTVQATFEVSNDGGPTTARGFLSLTYSEETLEIKQIEQVDEEPDGEVLRDTSYTPDSSEEYINDTLTQTYQPGKEVLTRGGSRNTIDKPVTDISERFTSGETNTYRVTFDRTGPVSEPASISYRTAFQPLVSEEGQSGFIRNPTLDTERAEVGAQGWATFSVNNGSNTQVDTTASSVSPSTTINGTTQEYDISVSIKNIRLNDGTPASGEVDVRIEDFELDDPESETPTDDLTLDYSDTDITDGTLSVSTTTNAVAPSTTGTRDVNVTDLRVNDGTESQEYLIEDRNITIGQIDVQQPSQPTAKIEFDRKPQDVSDGVISVDTFGFDNVDGSVNILVVNENGGSDGTSEEIIGSATGYEEGGSTVTLSENRDALTDGDEIRAEVYEIEDPRLVDDPLNTDTATVNGVQENTDIQYDPSSGGASGSGTGTDSDPKLFAEELHIETSNSISSFNIGGGNSIAFEIIKQSTGQTVTIEPKANEQEITANSAILDIYNSDGTIRDSPSVLAGSTLTPIDVTVSGDTTMFAEGVAGTSSSTSDPFAEYKIQLLAADGSAIDSTESRLIAIGYNLGSGVTQNGETGKIEVIVPRENLNEGFNSEWNARFSIAGATDIKQLGNDEQFRFTANVSGLDAGQYSYDLELYPDGTNISEYKILDRRIIGLSGSNSITVDDQPSDGGTQVDLDPSDLSGSGTARDPYKITNASELQVMDSDPDAYYVLNNDIDASGTAQWNNGSGFTPIGDDSEFTGAFDGNGYTITGLTVNRPDESNVGLFGTIGNGEIANVSLVNIDISGNEVVGGLAGDIDSGRVRSSYTTGTVSAEGSGVSGLVGQNSGTISSSYTTATVTGSDFQGGLVGLNSGSVSESYWDVEATGQPESDGGAQGLTTTEMTGQAARNNMPEFGFGTVWQTQENGYPTLAEKEQSTIESPNKDTYPDLLEDMDGSGSENDPYVITNISELQAIEADLDAHYVLGSNIDAAETAEWNEAEGFWNDPRGFTPIGDTLEESFTGTLDGDSHTISNLMVARSDTEDIGLFEHVGPSGTIKDVILTEADITGGSYSAGALAGVSEGTISNVSAGGNIAGSQYTGGIVGYSYGKIKRTSWSGSVDGGTAGGIAGVLDPGASGSTIATSYTTGSVNGEDAGGIVGYAFGGTSIEGSYSTASIAGETAGGLAGSARDGLAKDSYWDTNTTGQSTSAGASNEFGLITAQMTGQAARGNMTGFDFGENWQSRSGDYPVLQADEPDTPQIDISDSEITPSTTTVAESQDYEVSVSVDNLTAGDETLTGGEIDVQLEEFQPIDSTDGTSEDDLTIEYSETDVNDGTLTVSKSIAARAPGTEGPRDVYVTDLRRETTSGFEYLIEDARIDFDTIEVGPGGVPGGGSPIPFDETEPLSDSQTDPDSLAGKFRTEAAVQSETNVTLVENSADTYSLEVTAPDGATGVTFYLQEQAVSSSQDIDNVQLLVDGQQRPFSVIEDAGSSNSPWIRFTISEFSTRTVTFTSSTTHVVSADGTGDFETIQAAVDAATDGDTVEIRPESYSEEVVIEENITLIAPDGATLQGPTSDSPSVADGAGIQIAPDTQGGPISPTIRGLTIDGYYYGLFVGGGGSSVVGDFGDEATGDWRLENTTIQNSGAQGIEASEGTGDWRVLESRIEQTGFEGIYADGATGEWVVEDTVVTQTGRDGILARNTESPWELRNVTVRDSSGLGIEAGFNDADWTIRNTTIKNNSGDGFSNIAGIGVLGTSGNWLITESRIENNGGAGIGLDPGDQGIDPVSGNWTVSETRIIGNDGGIKARTAATNGNAARNYWGAPDGPAGDFSGSGDAATGNVTVSPFYSDQALTTPIQITTTSIDGGTATFGSAETETIRELSFQTDSDIDGQEVSLVESENVSSATLEILARDTPAATPISAIDIRTAPELNESDSNETATITARVPATTVEDPSAIEVVRVSDGTASVIPTTASETGDGQIEIEAETPAFSTFVIAETRPPAEEVSIQHDPSSGSATGTGPDPKLVAEKLTIAPSNSSSAISVGGDDSVRFNITKATEQTEQTVTVEPQTDGPVRADSLEFDIYDGDGTISDSPTIETGSEEISVSVSGDTGMFAAGVADTSNGTSEPFAEYEVRVLAGDGTVVDSTEPRLLGIGYNLGSGITQNASTGEIQFTVPRANLNDGVDAEWEATFSIGDEDQLAPIPVEQSAGADNFTITADTSDVPPGEYTYRLELYRSGTDVSNFEIFDRRVIGLFEVDAVTVVDQAELRVNASAADAPNTFETIQQAVNAAQSGDTISIAPGTYDGPSNGPIEVDKPVTIRGPNAGTPGAADSRTDEAVLETTLVTTAEDVTIDGVTISGSDAALETGIAIEPATGGEETRDIRLTNNVIKEVTAAGVTDTSVGIRSAGSEQDETFANLTITNNRISQIGDADTTQGLAMSLADLEGADPGDAVAIENNSISAIRAESPARPGTAIELQPTAGDTTGAGNTAARVLNNNFTDLGVTVTHPLGDDVALTEGRFVRTESETASRVRFRLPQAELVVAPDGADAGADTASIRTALDRAAIGTTISVRPGTYNESVRINTSDVTLTATGSRANTTIRHDASDGTPTVAVDAADVVVEGFSIKTGGTSSTSPQADRGVRVAAPGVEIRGNIIQQPGDDTAPNGILVTNQESTGAPVESRVDGVRVVNNEVGNFRSGVGIVSREANASTTIRNVTIAENTLGGDVAGNQLGIGIVERTGSSDLGDEIDLADNTFDGNGIGVYIFGDEDSSEFADASAGGVSITGNTFANPDGRVLENTSTEMPTAPFHIVNNGIESDGASSPVSDTVVAENDFAGAVKFQDDVVAPEIQPVLDEFVATSADDGASGAEGGSDVDDERVVEIYEEGETAYDGGVSVTTANVSLQGVGSSRPTVSLETTDSTPTINATADGVTVRGLEIVQDGDSDAVGQGVRVAGQNITIADNKLRDETDENVGTGISIVDDRRGLSVSDPQSGAGEKVDTNATVTGNTITGFATGVGVFSSSPNEAVTADIVSTTGRNEFTEVGTGVSISRAGGSGTTNASDPEVTIDGIDITASTFGVKTSGQAWSTAPLAFEHLRVADADITITTEEGITTDGLPGVNGTQTGSAGIQFGGEVSAEKFDSGDLTIEDVTLRGGPFGGVAIEEIADGDTTAVREQLLETDDITFEANKSTGRTAAAPAALIDGRGDLLQANLTVATANNNLLAFDNTDERDFLIGTGVDVQAPLEPTVAVATDGDTIHVEAGTYSTPEADPVPIAEGVTLRGPYAGTAPDDTVRNISDIDDEATIENTVAIGGSDVTIDGLRITGGLTSGTQTDARAKGIQLQPTTSTVSNITIRNTRVESLSSDSEQAATGISLIPEASSTGSVSDVTIQNNHITLSGTGSTGIELAGLRSGDTGSEPAIVEGNQITDPSVLGSTGVVVSGSSSTDGTPIASVTDNEYVNTEIAVMHPPEAIVEIRNIRADKTAPPGLIQADLNPDPDPDRISADPPELFGINGSVRAFSTSLPTFFETTPSSPAFSEEPNLARGYVANGTVVVGPGRYGDTTGAVQLPAGTELVGPQLTTSGTSSSRVEPAVLSTLSEEGARDANEAVINASLTANDAAEISGVALTTDASSQDAIGLSGANIRYTRSVDEPNQIPQPLSNTDPESLPNSTDGTLEVTQTVILVDRVGIIGTDDSVGPVDRPESERSISIEQSRIEGTADQNQATLSAALAVTTNTTVTLDESRLDDLNNGLIIGPGIARIDSTDSVFGSELNRSLYITEAENPDVESVTLREISNNEFNAGDTTDVFIADPSNRVTTDGVDLADVREENSFTPASIIVENGRQIVPFEPGSGFFDVAILNSAELGEAPIPIGGKITPTVSVTNSGDVPDQQDITVQLVEQPSAVVTPGGPDGTDSDATVVSNETISNVTLEPGETDFVFPSIAVPSELTPRDQDSGSIPLEPNFDLRVTSTDDQATVEGLSPARPAEFDVTINESTLPDAPTTGDTLTFSVDISNTGGREATREVTTSFGGNIINSTEVEVGADSQTTLENITIETTAADAGQQPLQVSTNNSRDSADILSIDLTRPAFVTADIIDTDPALGDPVAAGRDVTVVTELENEGATNTTRDVKLRINGTEEATESVELPSGETQVVQFTVTAETDQETGVDQQPLTIATGDDTETRPLQVEPAEEALAVAIRESELDDEVHEPVSDGSTTVTVPLVVENIGNQPTNGSVAVAVDGIERNATDVPELGVNNTTNTTVELPLNRGDAPEIDIRAETADDSDVETVDVASLPAFDVTIEQASNVSEPVPDDAVVTPTVRVENAGGQAGSAEVEIRFNDTSIATVPVEELDPSATRTIVSPSDTDPPQINLTSDAFDIDDAPTAVLEASVTNNATGQVQDNTFRRVSIGEAASFEVDSLDIVPSDDTVTTDDTVSVNATITNDGGVTATQTVTASFAGDEIGATTETLKTEESTTVTFTTTVDRSDIGSTNARVTTDDDTSTDRGPEVVQPASFEIDLATVPEPIAGEPFEIVAEVTNTGGEAASTTVRTTTAAGTSTEINTGEIDSGATELAPVSLTAPTRADAGESAFLIAETPDDIAFESVQLGDPGTLALTTRTVPQTVTDGTELTVSVTAENTGDGNITDERLQLFVDGGQRNQTTIPTLEGGESRTITLSTTVDRGLAPGGSTETTTAVVTASDTSTEQRSITVEPPAEPAVFKIANVDTTETLIQPPAGQTPTVPVNATITNVGETPGEQQITLHADGATVATERVELGNQSDGPPLTTQVAFDGFEVTPADAGRSINVRLASANRSVNTTVTVREAAPGTLDIVRAELAGTGPTTQGDTLSATVTVENPGDRAVTNGTLTFDYTANDTVATSDAIALAPGDTTTRSLELTVPPAPRAGVFPRDIALEAANATATTDTTTTTTPVDFEGIQSGVGAAASGDTVEIAPGEYQPRTPITIESPVTLTAANPLEQPIVNAPRDGPAVVVTDTAEGTAVEQLTMRGDGEPTDRAIVTNADTDLQRLTLANWGTAITEERGTVTVTETELRNTGTGISLAGAPGSTVAFTEVTNAGVGVTIDSADTNVETTQVSNAAAGIRVTTAGTTIEQSTIRENDVGIEAIDLADSVDDPGVVVDNSNIEANDLAIFANDATVDARENWWGTPEGADASDYVARSDVLIGSPLDKSVRSDVTVEDVTLTSPGTDDLLLRGESLTVEYELKNSGGADGSPTVELLVDGQQRQTQQVSVQGTTAQAGGGTTTQADGDTTTTASFTVDTVDFGTTGSVSEIPVAVRVTDQRVSEQKVTPTVTEAQRLSISTGLNPDSDLSVGDATAPSVTATLLDGTDDTADIEDDTIDVTARTDVRVADESETPTAISITDATISGEAAGTATVVADAFNAPFTVTDTASIRVSEAIELQSIDLTIDGSDTLTFGTDSDERSLMVTGTFSDGSEEARTSEATLTTDSDLVEITDGSTVTPTTTGTGTATIRAEIPDMDVSDTISVDVRRAKSIDAAEPVAEISDPTPASLTDAEIEFQPETLDTTTELEVSEATTPSSTASNAIQTDVVEDDTNTIETVTPVASLTIDNNPTLASDETATIRATVDATAVTDPQQVRVIRVADDGSAEPLPTTVQTTPTEIAVEATTTGFSEFVIAETTTDTSPPSDSDSDSDSSSSTGGGAGGGGGLSPSASVTTEIADAAPSTTGTTVEFSQSAVDAITFSGTASGTISIDDYEATTPPGAPDTGPRPVMAGVTIDAPSDVADQSATIRLTVDQTELLRADADPNEVAVLRATNGGYETLETTVVDDTGDVTLEAETSGFASFIVSTDEGDIGLSATPATQSPADESGTGAEPTPSETTQEETSPETTTTPPAEDQPGFGVIVAVTAMLIAGLLAVRRRLGYSSD